MKLYASIMGLLATFFGMPEATESELEQVLADSGTLADIKAKADADARAGVQASIDSLTEKVTGMEASVSGMKTELEGLKAELETAKQEAADAKATIATKEAEIGKLSGELATLRVANATKPTVTQTNDGGIATPAEGSQSKKGIVISNEQFAQMFNG